VEGEEGTCYVWGVEEVKKILGDEDGEAFIRYYSMTAAGNFEGANTLRIDPASKEAGMPPAEELKAMKEALFAERQKRKRPIRDDKVISAWNGLTISALVKAAEVFKRGDWTDAALQTARFVLENSRDKEGALTRYSIDGASGPKAVLEDVAIFGASLLDIHKATGDKVWLDKAQSLAEALKKDFYDDSTGLFYDTGEAPEGLFIRERDLFDTDVPSGNSAAANFFLKLARVREDEPDEALARSVLTSMGALADEPLYHGYALSVLESMLTEVS